MSQRSSAFDNKKKKEEKRRDWESIVRKEISMVDKEEMIK